MIRNSAAGALKSAPSRANMPSNSAVLAIEGCTETAIGVLTLTNSRPFDGEITAADLVLLRDSSPIWSATPAIAKRGRPPLAALEPTRACTDSTSTRTGRRRWAPAVLSSNYGDISLLKAEAVSYAYPVAPELTNSTTARSPTGARSAIADAVRRFCNQSGLSDGRKFFLFFSV